MQLLRYQSLSGGAWAFGGKTTAFAGFASNGLLARLLTLQELRAYPLTYSIVAFGAMVGSLGLATTLAGMLGAVDVYQNVMMIVSVGAGALTLMAVPAVVGSYGIEDVMIAHFTGFTMHTTTVWLTAGYKTGVCIHPGFSYLSWLVRSAS